MRILLPKNGALETAAHAGILASLLAIAATARNGGDPLLGAIACLGCSTLLAGAELWLRRVERDRERPPHARPKSALPRAEAEDVIVGLRGWRFSDLGSVAVLRSVVMEDVLWAAGRPTSSEPQSDAYDGIHAFKRIEDLDAFMAEEAHPAVVGKVALWGEVIEYDRGWKAEHAYPLHLFAPDRRTADMLERFYGCPCDVGSGPPEETAPRA